MRKTDHAHRILLTEDDPSLLRILEYKLVRKGYHVTTATNGLEALELLRKHPFNLLLTDVRMPKLDGIGLLAKAKELQPKLYVVLLTAHATVRQAVGAIKTGAFDYLTKPFEDEELFSIIEKIAKFQLLDAAREESESSAGYSGSTKQLIGESAVFRELMDTIHRVAKTDANVLISGESGTGKELVAHDIHDQSTRSKMKFVALNCAAIPKDLLESELFGHVRGAFTGADRDRKGRFELAEGGTILLDEIGELALELQGKLLRVLQEGQIDPVGAERGKSVNVRVLAATNVDLRDAVQQKSFREDLFYRLSVIPLNVPSLRDRSDDIPLLAETFLNRISDVEIRIDGDCLQAMQRYQWPGNIRELKNLIERMVALRRSDTLGLADLPDEILHSADANPAASTAEHENGSLDDIQRRAILHALEAEDWNQTRAALRLSIPRHVLLYRMKKLRIRKSATD